MTDAGELPGRREAVLRQPVHAADGDKAFGEFTLEDVQLHASELRAATGWGPTARIASVARAWSQLARMMQDAGVAKVAELEPEQLAAVADSLWVLPPGGSLLA